MSENVKEFIITWRIKNFSYSWHKNGEAIQSREFCSDTLDGTEWRLSISPRGRRDVIYYSLERNMYGPDEIRLNVEISFLDEYGVPALSQKLNNVLFKSDVPKVFYVKRNKVFGYERGQFLPGDILTVRCRLWTYETDTLGPEKVFSEIQLDVVRESISGTVRAFSYISTDSVQNIRITSASEKANEYKMNLQLREGVDCDENLMLQIIFPEHHPKKYSTCKVYLLDAVGNKLECAKSAMNFEEDQDWKFMLFPTKWKLMTNKNLYLPNNMLSLECDIIISTGIVNEIFEEIEDEISTELNPISNAGTSNNLPTSSSALNDLGNLYKEQVFCDVTLKTDTETFPAHTVILSARSSVFRAMFTSDMEEKKNACVNISDFDAEAVRLLLLYAYTDTLDDLKWDIAVQLYVAADKYAMISLKEKCSAFLKDSLCTSKVCELLVLSDTHLDIDLKKFVQNFICQNGEQILCLKEWKDLGQKNPQMIIETLSQMYTNVRAFLNV